jgi:hypothetical protein
MCKRSIFLTSFLVVLTLAGNAVAQIDPATVTDGHVYLFENVGTDVPDDSANNHTANLIGNPQVVDGLNGKALQFNGTTDGVHIPDATAVNLSTHQNRTVVAVFKCDDVDKTEKQTVYEEGGTTRGLTIYIHEGLAYVGGWNLSDYTPEWTGTYLSAPISSSAWYAVAMIVRDGGAAQEDDKFEMWLNGELIGKGPGGQLQSRSNDCGIGYHNSETKYHDGNNSTTGNYFEGAVDEVWIINQALTQVELTQWGGKPWPYASGPDPANGAMHEATWVTLSWRAGPFAVSHDVYVGENFDEVDEATRDSDVFRGNQAEDFIVAGFPGNPYPEGLAPGTTYYWRIDEVNDADPNSPWKGPVWSFSVPPKTAYNPDPADGAEFVDPNAPTLSWTPGFKAILHTVDLGDDYDTVNNATGGMPWGFATYRPGPLELEKVYYWRVDEFDGFGTFKGDVWSFTTPGAVGNPSPAYDAMDVGLNAVLNWMPSASAASHQLYFGTDKEAVRTAGPGSPEDKGSKALGAESYDPGLLAAETTYYWRVDEVDGQGNTSKGPLWIFTTGAFLLVEDFEAYTDDDVAGEAIWQHWIDGFGVPDNGSQVGNLLPPYAEQTIVHGGSQSMPLLYVNEAGVTNSEATLTLTTPRDWTQAGVAALSLWFRGASGNAAEPIYVAVSNSAGAPAVVAQDDPDAATVLSWKQWRIPSQAFADQGINLTNVDKIAIGLGSKAGMAAAGGSGGLYIDDIRLYR